MNLFIIFVIIAWLKTHQTKTSNICTLKDIIRHRFNEVQEYDQHPVRSGDIIPLYNAQRGPFRSKYKILFKKLFNLSEQPYTRNRVNKQKLNKKRRPQKCHLGGSSDDTPKNLDSPKKLSFGLLYRLGRFFWRWAKRPKPTKPVIRPKPTKPIRTTKKPVTRPKPTKPIRTTKKPVTRPKPTKPIRTTRKPTTTKKVEINVEFDVNIKPADPDDKEAALKLELKKMMKKGQVVIALKHKKFY